MLRPFTRPALAVALAAALLLAPTVRAHGATFQGLGFIPGGAAYPNPFDGRTTVGYDVAETSRVRLVVYDLLARGVARLVDAEREAGRHEAVLDDRGLGAGVYLVRMTTEAGFTQTRRVTLLR